MTFMESIKIVWLLQFVFGGLIVVCNYKEMQEEAAEENIPEPVLRVVMFLAACFAGWFLIYDFLKNFAPLPFWLRHPVIWFKGRVLWDLRIKRRDFKAWYIRKQRRLTAKCG